MDPLLRSPIKNLPLQKQTANFGGGLPKAAPNLAKKQKKLFVGIAVFACLAIILLLGTWWLIGKNESDKLKKDHYQSIFLTSGQVYFGKIADLSGKYISLYDVYYLQTQQTVQPTDGKKDLVNSQDLKPQLVKLGNELHAPEDEMQISRDQVLFWENIKSDGQVAKAISEFKNK